MKKIVMLISAVMLSACTKIETGTVIEIKEGDGIRCMYVVYTGELIEPYRYEIDSCGKWNLQDTVNYSN